MGEAARPLLEAGKGPQVVKHLLGIGLDLMNDRFHYHL